MQLFVVILVCCVYLKLFWNLCKSVKIPIIYHFLVIDCLEFDARYLQVIEDEVEGDETVRGE